MSERRVKITDVVLRDGLQDEDVFVATEDKIAVARALVASGVDSIEATSFVDPRRIPQLADAEMLLALLPPDPAVRYSALALNARGVDRAVGAGTSTVQIAVSAGPSHSRANAGRGPDEALAEFATVVEANPGISFIGAVSTAFVCPFDGEIEAAQLVRVARAFADMGVERIGLADTLGIATTEHVLRSVSAVREAMPHVALGLHLHDAHGQALTTALTAATELRIEHFDSAAGGYGGCPYAPGAHGNLATEKLVAHFHSHGVETGIDEPALDVAVRTVREAIARGSSIPPSEVRSSRKARS